MVAKNFVQPNRYGTFTLQNPFGKNYNVRENLRNRTNVRNRFTRRNQENRRFRNNGVEINRAEGGFKRINNSGIIKSMGINIYGDLNLIRQNASNNTWEYYFGVIPLLNVTEKMNEDQEFINAVKNSSQYKVVGVSLMLQNNRIPQAGDLYARLLLSAVTDKVSVNDLTKDNNVMKLNMSTLGTKNFNFRFNIANTNPENLAWQSSENLWNGIAQVRIQGESLSNLAGGSDLPVTVKIGSFKVTVHVLLRTQDTENSSSPTMKVNIREEIEKLKTKLNRLKLLGDDDNDEEQKEKGKTDKDVNK
jgi:hypothetical protein